MTETEKLEAKMRALESRVTKKKRKALLTRRKVAEILLTKALPVIFAWFVSWVKTQVLGG